MTRGQRFAPERRSYRDPRTGTRITQLTDHKGHSYPLYFTNSGWWDGGRRLVFGSDRGNRSDLYSLEAASGDITQLTDRGQPPRPPKPRSCSQASTRAATSCTTVMAATSSRSSCGLSRRAPSTPRRRASRPT